MDLDFDGIGEISLIELQFADLSPAVQAGIKAEYGVGASDGSYESKTIYKSQSGLINGKEYDRIVDPRKMIKPY